MQYRLNAAVQSLGGDPVGHLNRLVVSSSAQEITHLIVHRDGLFGDDRVVAIDHVEQAASDVITLFRSADDRGHLPLWNEIPVGGSEQLHAIWNSGRSGAARRREIFEKWQDCDDDKAEVSSRKGRHVIEDFIKTYLPEDSPDAYTSEELQKLNADRGELSPFSPYRLR